MQEGSNGDSFETIDRLLSALKIDPVSRRETSFAFSTRAPLEGWKAFTVKAAVPIYLLRADQARASQVFSFASGINKEAFIFLAALCPRVAVVVKGFGNSTEVRRQVVTNEDDLERLMTLFRSMEVTESQLMAYSSLSGALEKMRSGAEKNFVNLNLFSSYYLNERMDAFLSERNRKIPSEVKSLYDRLGEEIPPGAEGALKTLSALGYSFKPAAASPSNEYRLYVGSHAMDATCVVTDAKSLDIKASEETVPSYEAVSALKHGRWVILTNGRLWRLYSARTSSSATNYFEVDMDGLAGGEDTRLKLLASLFSASSLVPRAGLSDLDAIYDEGQKYVRGIENELRTRVFKGQLFLNIVRAVLEHSNEKKHSEGELEEAKATSLRLLYRLLFILYAESRSLLPVRNAVYEELSLQGIRTHLNEFEKKPTQFDLWRALSELFKSIKEGNPVANVPEYDGELFGTTDGLEPTRKITNKYLVLAVRDLCETNGEPIDYQNLGVRQLGSLYEALLENDVRQTQSDLVIYKDGSLDAAYAKDMKAKPIGLVEKGDLYLSPRGMARKGTGSYYTPEEIVSFLVSQGLQPILESRRVLFEAHMGELQSGPSGQDVEDRTIDDLLGIKVVDPAMGSGHFLVTAVDQITNWIIGILRDYPNAPLARLIDQYREEIFSSQRDKGISIDTDFLTDSIILKRLVMKRCVYGVDINLLAVELAKLSLWLDSFTIGTPLTFLDHHIKEGDSLIGLWLDDIEKRTGNDTIDEWVDDLSSTGSSLTSEVAMPADLTAAQTEESRKNYDRFMQKTRPLRIVLDVATAEIIDERLGKAVPRNLPLIEKTATSQVKPPWWSSVEASVTLAKRFKSFQWELEFPDVYRKNSVSGFDLIITNPPWDAVKPKDTEYFSQYYPGFRKIQGKQERLKIKKQLLQDPGIAKGFEAYKLNIQQKLNFFKNPATYVRRGSGDTNLWKLFLERVLRLRGPNGNLAIVVPSGILNDEGAKELREELFKNRIRFVYEFENTEGIFNIHRSYKFVLLVADRAPPSSSFKAAFYLHKVAALKSQAEREKFIDVPFTLVLKSAPDSLTIPELRNKDQLEVFSKIYATQPLLSDKNKSWTVKLIAELHQTNDSKIFRRSTQGWPLIEGKDFWQFDPNYEKPTFTIDPKDGLARTKHHEEYRYINEAIHNNVRLAFRDIGSSTNTRSVVACLLPPHSFSPNTAIIVQPSIDSETIIDDRYTRLISYLEGVFNSFVFDFLIRSRIFMHLNFFYVYQTPVPKDYDGKLARRIQQCAACLNFVDDRFDQLGIVLEVPRAPAELSKRIELTAELNALVATHYGLSRSEVEVILKSFDGFEEDDSLSKRTGEVTWDPVLIRKFNGEVRKRVLHYFDLLGEHT